MFVKYSMKVCRLSMYAEISIQKFLIYDWFFISVGNASSSANTAQSQQAFIFHVQNQQPLTHKAAVYYHQQLALQEDQGEIHIIFFS